MSKIIKVDFSDLTKKIQELETIVKSREEEIALKDVVDILCDYELRHGTLFSSGTDIAGLVDYGKKRIYIDPSYDLAMRRKAVIHELYHVFDRFNGLPNSERDVSRQTRQTYEKIYGGKR